MNLLWQGILLGVALSILAGPTTFVFIQVAIARGFRAGVAVGMGTWCSDLLYAWAAYAGVSWLLSLTAMRHFSVGVGLVGAVVIFAIGLSLLLGAYREAPISGAPASGPPTALGKRSYGSLWLRGFLINTFNPFAAFFWLSLSTGASAQGITRGRDIALLFGGIIGTIVFADLLKIGMAKQLRKWLTPRHARHAELVSGVVLVLFAAVMLVRAWLEG